MKKTNDQKFPHSTVIADDGTTIGYKSIGNGPSLLVIHGALSDSDDFTMLATELSSHFTVHIMDRRGRGMSGPQGDRYSIQTECDDVQKIQAATGASFIIGHSYGGLVALEYAKQNSSIPKLALYEPGVLIDHDKADWLKEYELDMDKQDFRGAFAAFVKGSAQSPLAKLPKWYAKLVLRMVIRGEHWKKIRGLLAENGREHREVYRLAGTYQNYATINAAVLLMAGEKSPTTVIDMIQTLDKTINHTKVITFPNMDHFGPDNKNQPDIVAANIVNYFLENK